MKEILWKDIEIGNIMMDGSSVTQIHSIHTLNCLRLKTKSEDLILSEDHLILCDISKIKKKFRQIIFNESFGKIPLVVDYLIMSEKYLDEAEKEKIYKEFDSGTLSEDFQVQEIIVKDESKIFDIKKNLVWLTILEIHTILNKNIGKIFSGGKEIKSTEYVGEKRCFCISTDTGKYITSESGVIHHNSVTIRNIIFHCLTHGIKIGMVDLKITEFESYKNCRDVIGVANTAEEAVEILRIARTLMYKRNKELAKAGVVDIVDYKPRKLSDKVSVFGREYLKTDKLMIRDDDNNEREITFDELVKILEEKNE